MEFTFLDNKLKSCNVSGRVSGRDWCGKAGWRGVCFRRWLIRCLFEDDTEAEAEMKWRNKDTQKSASTQWNYQVPRLWVIIFREQRERGRVNKQRKEKENGHGEVIQGPDGKRACGHVKNFAFYSDCGGKALEKSNSLFKRVTVASQEKITYQGRGQKIESRERS